jgi:hypothetical protein
VPQVQILGELVSLGAPAALALRYIIRDVLDYRWKCAVLRRTPEGQLAKVVAALNANRREIGK